VSASTEPPCIACEVNAGRVNPPGGRIYEDRYWIADHGLDRLVRGYVVLKPRRHVHELADLEVDEALALGPAMRRVVAAIRSALAPDRVYVCSFAETVHHVHFHLLPRYPDMPALGRNLLRRLFAAEWTCTEEEARSASERIQAFLG
jgi:diadenosine tetraphosphate (Ap4A) HIT family hydrolase